MRFAITGVCGFVAPRHLNAIREIGGTVVAALDPHDSAGLLDNYNKRCQFFTEPERFDRHLDQLRRAGKPVDWLVVCSPNHLHDAHVRLGLRNGCNVLCEKPLALQPKNVDALAALARECDRKVRTVLQLRLHPMVMAWKKQLSRRTERSDVLIEYYTPRGRWYHYSWKGDEARSGGIVTNIGVHLFDMMIHLFGDLLNDRPYEFVKIGRDQAEGTVRLQRADVRWRLSTSPVLLPTRRIFVNGDRVDLSAVEFENGHTAVYEETILRDGGWAPEDARPAIALCHAIRTANEGRS